MTKGGQWINRMVGQQRNRPSLLSFAPWAAPRRASAGVCNVTAVACRLPYNADTLPIRWGWRGMDLQIVREAPRENSNVVLHELEMKCCTRDDNAGSCVRQSNS